MSRRALSLVASTLPFRTSPRITRHASLSRLYATQPTKPSGLLDEAFARDAQQARRERVGPLPLGMARPNIRYDEKVPKWAELSSGGKVARATARTGNLAVILIGGGLTAVLVYALTSELFSPNSPTRVYAQACDKISASLRIAQYLHTPLKFHNAPPSAVRPRHRNSHVSSQIALDSAGREHMFLTFFVAGADPNAPPAPEGLADRLAALGDMSWDELTAAAHARADSAWHAVKTAVRYVAGKPTLTIAPTPTAEADTPVAEARGAWSFVGLFSSLRTSKTEGGASSVSGQTFAEGEVHAELIRNDDGYFVFRYLLVDIPNSRTRQRNRVFVERAPGVSENEHVMLWG